MAKAKGKKRRSPADMARLEFRKTHGRWPAKGELTRKRRSTRSSTTRPSRSTDADAAAAKRRRAAKRAAKTRSKLGWKVKNWVKQNPVKATLVALGGAGGTTLAVSPTARKKTAEYGNAALALVRRP